MTLTDLTRQSLHDTESELWVPWAVAQRASAEQKVDASIEEGFKKYWLNLGTSTVFQGHVLMDFLSRIHLDILEIWNFRDPFQLLSGPKFRSEMMKVIEPLATEPREDESPETLSNASQIVSIAGVVATPFAQALASVSIAAYFLKFLYQRYQAIPTSAQCLGAYIVDLTLILHELFMSTIAMDPPRALTEALVDGALHGYKDNGSASEVHKGIREIARGKSLHPEKDVVALIKKHWNTNTAR